MKIINERTKSGRLAKGKNELYLGGRVPFGYTLIDSDRLTLNYKEADIIKEIFKLRTKGMSIGKIALKYNKTKILRRLGIYNLLCTTAFLQLVCF